uniref:hypothetical protein n=1 Tax=Lysobacter antibioticus TaxID=84531 RepID=UPI0011403F81
MLHAALGILLRRGAQAPARGWRRGLAWSFLLLAQFAAGQALAQTENFCEVVAGERPIYSLSGGGGTVTIRKFFPGDTAMPTRFTIADPGSNANGSNGLMVDSTAGLLLYVNRDLNNGTVQLRAIDGSGAATDAAQPFTVAEGEINAGDVDVVRGAWAPASPAFPNGVGYISSGSNPVVLYPIIPVTGGTGSNRYTIGARIVLTPDFPPEGGGTGDLIFSSATEGMVAVGRDFYAFNLTASTLTRLTRPVLADGSENTNQWNALAATANSVYVSNNTGNYLYNRTTGRYDIPFGAASVNDTASCAVPTGFPLVPNISGLVKTLASVNGTPYVAGEPIKAGDTLVYRLQFRNTGSDAGTVYTNNVIETIPPNTTYLAGHPEQDFGTCTVTGTTLNCTPTCSGPTCVNINTVAVPAGGTGDLTLVVEVNDPLPSGVAEINNVVAATIGRRNDGTGGTPINCAAPGNDCTEVTPIINVVKTLITGGPTAAAGETLVYQIQLTNSGTTPATIPVGGVTETVPTATTAAAGDSFNCAAGAAAGTSCTNTAAVTIAPGASQDLTFRVTVLDPLPAGTANIVNTVALPQFVDCASPGNDCSEDTPTAATVTLSKALTSESGTQAGIAEAGETLTYTI